MVSYVALRTGRLVLTAFLVLLFAFVALRLSGTPIDEMYPDGITAEAEAALLKEWGLDRPLHEQFVLYVGQVLQGDFGVSLQSRRPVLDIYLDVLPPTLILGGAAFVLSILLAIPLGVFCALRYGSGADSAINAASFIVYGMPHFITAILLIYLMGYVLHWLPTVGAYTPLHYVLPVAVLTLGSLASLTRYMRGTMLEQLGAEYLRTARSKGLSEGRVVFRHAFRNALIPIVTLIGLDVVGIVTGSLLVEAVFAWPGVGRVFIGAVQSRDYAVFQCGILFYSFIVVAVNYLVDLAYVLLDPRIRVDA